jgi:hypothetical protein
LPTIVLRYLDTERIALELAPGAGEQYAPSHTRRSNMLIYLAIAIFVLWLLGFGVFHVAGAAVHLLLILAVVALVVYFIRAVSTRTVA